MSQDGWLAILSLISTAVLGVLHLRSGRRSTDQTTALKSRELDDGRLEELGDRVEKLEGDLRIEREYNRRLWDYCRRLLDLYYRHRTPGSPDPDPLPREQ